MSAAKELSVLAHRYRTLIEHLQNKDKEGAIETIYQLLSEGHSVNDIIEENSVFLRAFSTGNGAAEYPQSESGRRAITLVSEPASAEVCQPSATNDAAVYSIEKRNTTSITPHNKFKADERKQLAYNRLPESEHRPVILLSTNAPASYEISTNFPAQEKARLSRSISTKIGILQLVTAGIVFITIAILFMPYSDHDNAIELSKYTHVVSHASADDPLLVDATLPSAAAAGNRSRSQPTHPDAGNPLHAMRTAPFDLTLPSEAPPIAPTQSANDTDDPEPPFARTKETTQAIKLATAKMAPPMSAPQTYYMAPAATSDAEHLIDDEQRGAQAIENAEVARAESPNAAPPLALEAVPVPHITKIAPNESLFEPVEAAVLVNRGDAFFAAGELTSARLFYEFAAATGDGTAALRLGSTFDPAFLARVRVGRVQGDIPSALYWYRRARDLGNHDAEILLKGVESTAR